jgi:hypothetical protein
LLQLCFGLLRFRSFLRHKSVGRFPHVVIFDYVFEGLPGKLKEIYAI